jgi:hypothetical protein
MTLSKQIIRTTIPNPNWHEVSTKDALHTFSSCLDLHPFEAMILLNEGETIMVGVGQYKLAQA